MTGIANPLFEPLILPNGATIPNRICKAAMEENLSDAGQLPGERLNRLYRRWAQGGAGLLLTGNVMVAADALTGPGGVVLEKHTDLVSFQRWATAGKSGGGQFWMQINHPGRQVYANMGEDAVSASDVPVDLGDYSKLFAKPRALEEGEIETIIERFAETASLAEKAGFTGVQIHAAHGYLINQFLSPLTNKRTDQWGGTLENRARLLLAVVERVRSRTSDDFCLSVKLNSSDFQKGGFDQSDAKWVVEQLNDMQVDLVELSGGSYESPAMQGRASQDSTGLREAYFIDFAKEISAVAKMPIMITGGIRRLSVAQKALDHEQAGSAVDMLGVARALAFDPELPNNWLNAEKVDVAIPEVKWKNTTLAGVATMAVAKAQLERLAKDLNPKPNISPLLALVGDRFRTNKRLKRYRRWRNQREN
ncbi:oxidoreductase [Sphingorhabdus sp. Alg231-15]|uniref:oxidoreductase n=1 Tax=Sphingorhabdus sp. Alg231-15 TaxID=1922222 RepID=UPI000D55E07C